ncbi:chemotaxis protein CheW [Geminisphaera colitermitum]|uniref:chemotaxis protein CheW n=1 Tax=Geminisphaera colitermitum TaxID=1148786 RepID=UPI000158D019|nr:chemotaxis protein CheW [Geminisphaera colitermitum]
MSQTAPSITSHIGKYLTVVLDKESYGIEVLKVREIIRMQKITPVPRTPAYVKGIINLRGRVIPIIDLRMKFGLNAEMAERTCIVVVQVNLNQGTPAQMGLIVDSVEEVTTLSAGEIEPTPDFGARIDTTCLLGLAKIKGVVKTLLDIDQVIAHDLVELPGAAAPAADAPSN